MKECILLDEHKIKKMKKRIKKSLDDLGLNLKQSEVAEIIAKSLGFKNDYELRNSTKVKFLKTIPVSFNNPINLIQNPNIIIDEKYQLLIKNEDGKKIINLAFNRKNPEVINDKVYYNELIRNLYDNHLKNINGNILICGTSGSGKTLLTSKIKEISKNSNNKLISIVDFKENNILGEELKTPDDFDILAANSKENILFSIYGQLSDDLITITERIKRTEEYCQKSIDLERIKVIIQLGFVS